MLTSAGESALRSCQGEPIYSNNPTGLAHSFLRGPDYKEDVVLSIGTGSMEQAYRFEQIRGLGLLTWASPVLKMTFDGQAEAVSMALERRLGPRNYVRLQELLDGNASDDLDDVSPDNLKALKNLAARIIDANRAALDALCARLLD